MFNRLILAAAILVAATAAALAQEPEPFVIDLSPIFNDFLVPLLGTILSGVVIWAATRLGKKFGFDVEARHREALQEAIMNAAGLAAQKFLGDKSEIKIGSKVIADSAQYVIRAVPDALAYFKLSTDAIAEKILAKLPQLPSPQVVVEEVAAVPAPEPAQP